MEYLAKLQHTSCLKPLVLCHTPSDVKSGNLVVVWCLGDDYHNDFQHRKLWHKATNILGVGIWCTSCYSLL